MKKTPLKSQESLNDDSKSEQKIEVTKRVTRSAKSEKDSDKKNFSNFESPT